MGLIINQVLVLVAIAIIIIGFSACIIEFIMDIQFDRCESLFHRQWAWLCETCKRFHTKVALNNFYEIHSIKPIHKNSPCPFASSKERAKGCPHCPIPWEEYLQLYEKPIGHCPFYDVYEEIDKHEYAAAARLANEHNNVTIRRMYKV